MLWPNDLDSHIDYFLYLRDRANGPSLNDPYPQPDPSCGCCGTGNQVCKQCNKAIRKTPRILLIAAADYFRNRQHIPYLAVTDELIRRNDEIHRKYNYPGGFGTTFLKKVRTAAKLTQKEMAKALRISERQVRNIETSEQLPSEKLAERLITFAGKVGFRRWKHPGDQFWDYDLPWNIPPDAIFPNDTDQPEQGGATLQGCSGSDKKEPLKAA